MKLFSWRRSATIELDDDQRLRLEALQATTPQGDIAISEGRMVVVDVETTGLNLAKDIVLSIGAVAIEGGAIDFGQCFECTLRRVATPGASTLIHGLGPEALAQGDAPADALLAFLEYLGDSPLLAFHADFDRQMLTRALKEDLGYRFEHPFLDIAELAPALLPDAMVKRGGLDEWIAHFGLAVQQRHHASADALVSAELALILFNLAIRDQLSTYEALREHCAKWRRRRTTPAF